MADAPIGVVYNTSMTRPDAALALAAVYMMQRKKECRVGSVCVAGAGFGAAVFCDMVAKMYTRGNPNSNQVLPVGFANDGSPDPAMVKTAVAHDYPRTIRRITDTSAPEAVLRNGVIFNAESAIILSARATELAKTLDLAGVKDLFRDRVKRLVIVGAGSLYKDAVALRRVIDEWPSPVFYLPNETGGALRFPGASFEQDFSWAPAHPVVDAYEAYSPMPYDAPLGDLAAMHYAIHPESGFFGLSAAGRLDVAEDGRLNFTPGGGNVKRIEIVPEKKTALLAVLIDAATGRTGPPTQAGAVR
jgi:purine nucleosidase